MGPGECTSGVENACGIFNSCLCARAGAPSSAGLSVLRYASRSLNTKCAAGLRVASSVFAVRKNGETNLHHVAHGKRDIAGGFHDGMRHGFEFAFRHVCVRTAHTHGGNSVAREIEDGRREAAVVRLGLLAIDGPSATTHAMQIFQELLFVRDGVGRVR